MPAALPIPRSIDQIDAHWLTRALSLPEGAILGLSPGPGAGGIAVTAQVARLTLALAPGVDGPASVFVKIVNPAWELSRELYVREVRFYRELAGHHGPFVPRCHHADLDRDDQGFVLVLEDLSDAVPGHRLQGLDRAEAAAVLRAVAQVHARWWGAGELRALDWPAKTYTEPCAEQLADRFEARWPSVRDDPRFTTGLKIQVAARGLDARIVPDLLGLNRGPRTLVHGDLHVENLLLDGERVVLLDWQNAAISHPAFDVASVVSGATDAGAQREGHGDLLRVYLDTLRAHGVDDWPAEALVADVAAATRWYFAGICSWLAVFQPESPRDAETSTAHLDRIGAGLLACRGVTL